MKRSLGILALAATTALTLGACSSTPETTSSSSTGTDTEYPLTVTNCETEVVFDSAPERVLLLEPAPVSTLAGLGVLDRVVARAGDYSPEYFSDDVNAALAEIPTLTDQLDASGHLELSQEVVIAQNPDLVFGLPDGMTREGLAAAGANTLVQNVYCDTARDASFETLYSQIREYGTIFDKQEEADALVSSLQERVAAAQQTSVSGRTAAVLYPTIGGGPLYAYGRASMAEPQLEAAGFDNVFSDTSERVFEVTMEELLGRDPDVIVLLGQGDISELEDELVDLPGAESLTAVRNGDILTQLFNFTEPATPLVVDGLENIVDRFGQSS